MPRIFISYRRADSELITDRIYERLAAEFGERDVFLDVEPDDIPAGADFRKILQDAVAQCDIILVIIGPTWLNIKENSDPTVRRLENENDFVRIEVKTGLEREQRDQILVIPVLVGGAQMPSDKDLPPDLQELAFRNARPMRRNPDFDLDMNRLIDRIKDHSSTIRQKSSGRLPRRFWVFGAALGALVIVMLLIANNIIQLTPSTPEPTLDERSQAMTVVAQNQFAVLEANRTVTFAAIMTSFVTETSFAINANGTATADAYTDTPTASPTPSNIPTDDYTATAYAQGTLDAQATLNVPTNTSLPTSTPTPTLTSTPMPTLSPTPNIVATQTAEVAQLATAQQNAEATQAAARTKVPGENGNNLSLQIKANFEGYCIDVSSDGRSLIVSGEGVYDVATGLKRIDITNDGVFSPDGKLLVVDGDGVYDVATGLKRFVISNRGRFSPDGKLLVVDGDGVYDVATGLKRIDITNYGVFSPDSSLVVVDYDGVYDIATGLKRFDITNYGVFSPDSSLVAVNGDGVYDVTTGLKRFDITNYGVFSPDSSLVAVGGDGIYDAVTGQKRFAIVGQGIFSPNNSFVILNGDGIYDAVTGQKRFDIASGGVFSPDSSLVAVNQDGVYDVATGQKRFTIAGSGYFNPDGTLFMTDRGIYSVANGEQVTPLRINLHLSLEIATLYVDRCYLLASGASAPGSPKGFLVSNSQADFDFRQQPSSNSTMLETYSTLAFFTLSQEGEWYKVEYAAGEFGWVSASVVDVVTLPIILPTGSGQQQ